MVKYFKDALRATGLVHASNSEWSSALNLADKKIISPKIYDHEYIDFILSYSKKNNIKAIISLFDIDLPVLAQAKELFKENGIQLIVSDYPVTKICNDKWLSYKFLTDNNISTPKTFIDLDEVIDLLNKKNLSFPLIIKPRWGMGSISIYESNNINELNIFYSKVKDEISNNYLRYESESDYDKSVVIQQKISGIEFGLDVINDLECNYVATFIKEKISMRSGETDSAITVNNAILEQVGEKISKELKHIAILDVDCFLDDNNRPYVLEMNCRFGGHYPFSHLSGANIPLAIVMWLLNKEPPKSLFKLNYGVKGIKEIIPKIVI